MNFAICDAIRQKKCVELWYQGIQGVAEVHAYGVDSKGHEVIRVWQVRGASAQNEPPGWKLLRVETQALRLVDEQSQAPRTGYRRGDRAMRRFYCQV
jgi:hypothetical protein